MRRGRAPCQLAWQEASLAASTCRELSTLPFLAHFAARGGEVGEEEGILYVAVLATKLIHLPDEPAGVGQIGTQTVEVPFARGARSPTGEWLTATPEWPIKGFQWRARYVPPSISTPR